MKIAAVRDISEQVHGVTYAKSEASAAPRSGYSPILRANNIGEHGLLLDDLIFVPNTKISSKQRIMPNDVVVAASSGSISVVGKSAQVRKGFNGGFGAFCKVLRPGSDVDPYYFGHYFKTASYRRIVSQLAAGVNINNLKKEHLDNLQIPLPPITEQKRIARILDATDALRTMRREAIAQLDALVKSTFLDMFGDPVTNPKGLGIELLGELITTGPQNGLYKPQRYYGSGVRILRIDGFFGGVVNDLSALKRVDVSEKDVQKYGLSESDIVINRVNSRSHLGKSALIPELGGEPVVYESNMMRLAVDSTRVSPLFMIHLLQTSFIRNQILRSAKDSINQSSINQGDVKALRILVPSMDSQRHFVSIAESIGHQKGRCSAHLTELDTLFASLQSRAFRGDL